MPADADLSDLAKDLPVDDTIALDEIIYVQYRRVSALQQQTRAAVAVLKSQSALWTNAEKFEQRHACQKVLQDHNSTEKDLQDAAHNARKMVDKLRADVLSDELHVSSAKELQDEAVQIEELGSQLEKAAEKKLWADYFTPSESSTEAEGCCTKGGKCSNEDCKATKAFLRKKSTAPSKVHEVRDKFQRLAVKAWFEPKLNRCKSAGYYLDKECWCKAHKHNNQTQNHSSHETAQWPVGWSHNSFSEFPVPLQQLSEMGVLVIGVLKARGWRYNTETAGAATERPSRTSSRLGDDNELTAKDCQDAAVDNTQYGLSYNERIKMLELWTEKMSNSLIWNMPSIYIHLRKEHKEVFHDACDKHADACGVPTPKFDNIDTDGSGTISREEWLEAYGDIAEFDSADTDKRGEISKKEYSKYLRATRIGLGTCSACHVNWDDKDCHWHDKDRQSDKFKTSCCRT